MARKQHKRGSRGYTNGFGFSFGNDKRIMSRHMTPFQTPLQGFEIKGGEDDKGSPYFGMIGHSVINLLILSSLSGLYYYLYLCEDSTKAGTPKADADDKNKKLYIAFPVLTTVVLTILEYFNANRILNVVSKNEDTTQIYGERVILVLAVLITTIITALIKKFVLDDSKTTTTTTTTTPTGTPPSRGSADPTGSV